LRLNGISHWVMWEMASLFEHIGTVQDGMATLSRTRAVVDDPAPRRCRCRTASCASTTWCSPTAVRAR
jgi:hypothetical protein